MVYIHLRYANTSQPSRNQPLLSGYFLPMQKWNLIISCRAFAALMPGWGHSSSNSVRIARVVHFQL